MGGSGQTSWSDTTKFDSSSNVTTSTAGQATLTNTEELSNTGFESNLTGWDASAGSLGTSLNAFWKLDETSGTRSDSVGSNNLTDNNTVTQTTGKIGNAAQFTGANSEYLSLADNSSLSVGDIDFTFAGWVYPDNGLTSDVTTVLGKIAVYGSDTLEYKLETRTDGNLVFYVTNGSGTLGSVVAGTGSLSVGQWTFFVVWHDSSSDQVGIQVNNSSPVTASFSAGSYDSTAPFEIGRTGGGTNFRYWDGRIDAVGFWKKVLSSSERSTLYNSGSGVEHPFYTNTRDTSTTYNSSSGSSKIVAVDATNFTQSINVGNTNTYNLSTYAYTDGSAVTSSDVELFYNGSTVSTTYTSAGSGWYQLTGTVTGADASRQYGVQVKANKTVYVDNMSLNSYASSGTLTSSIFDAEQASDWGSLTYSATTPSNTSVSVKVRSSNSSSMSGATEFSSCTAITSGSDLSSNSCITDGHRYIQYQATLSNTDSVSTPTLEDLSIAFSYSSSIFSLDSPGDNSYISSERPTFKWKAPSSTTGLSKYVLEVDNPSVGSSQPSGDFTIDDIPLSRTSDYETNKYTIHYENFSDSDDTNNYISVYTKSHTDWGSNENDGKLKEGKVSWKVKAVGGNETSNSRTLFVDRTGPKVEVTQINSVPFTTSNISTTDKTPTIYGKITDPLAGGDSSQNQDENGPKVASGPKQVEIKLERKQGTGYVLHTIYTINMDKSWYTCDGKEVTDNSKQKCDKYLPFEYSPKDALDLGTYKITLTGKDKADNSSSETSFTLNITTLARVTTPEERKVIEEEIKELPKEEQEQARDELEITKPIEPQGPSAFERTTDSLKSLLGNIVSGVGQGIRLAFNITGQTLALVGDSVGKATAFVGQKSGEGVTALAHSTQSILTSAGQGISTAAKGAGDLLASIGQGIGATGNAIGERYNQLANNAPGVAKTVLTGIGDGVSTATSTITSAVKYTTDTTSTFVQNTGNIIAGAANNVGKTTSTIAQNTTKTIRNVTNAVVTTTSTIAKNTGAVIATVTQRGVNTAKDGIANATFKVGEKTQDVSDTVGIAIMKLGSQFVTTPTTISDVQVAILSSTAVKVSWQTNHPANGKVNYGLDRTYPFDIQSEKRLTHHEFTLTELEPDTLYYFEVMSHNKNYVYDANREFKTPAE